MKRTLSLFLLTLVALALPLGASPNLSSDTPSTSTPAPACNAATPLPFTELPPFLTAQATGCSTSQCNASCRAQGYDFGVCLLGSYCACRFYFP